MVCPHFLSSACLKVALMAPVAVLDPDCEIDSIEDIDDGDNLLIKGPIYYVRMSHHIGWFLL